MGRAPVNYVNAQMAAHMAYMPASTPYAMQPVQGMAHQVSESKNHLFCVLFRELSLSLIVGYTCIWLNSRHDVHEPGMQWSV